MRPSPTRPPGRGGAWRGVRSVLGVLLVLLAAAGPRPAVADASRLEEARTLAATKDYDGALRLYNTLLADEPTNLDALQGKARLQAWMGDYDSARSTYGRALALAPDRLESLLGAADLLAWEGRSAESIAQVSSLLPRHAENREVLIRLARYHRWAGDEHAARDYAQRVLASAPEDAEALGLSGAGGPVFRVDEIGFGQRSTSFGGGLYGQVLHASLGLEAFGDSRLFLRYDHHGRHGDSADRLELGAARPMGSRWNLSGSLAMAPGAPFLPVAAGRCELACTTGDGLVLYGDARLADYRDASLASVSMAAEYYAGRHLVLTLKPTFVQIRFAAGQVARDTAVLGKGSWYFGDRDHVFAFTAYGNEAYLVEAIDTLRDVGVLTLGAGGAYYPVSGLGVLPSFEVQVRSGGRRHTQFGLEIRLRR